MRKILSLIALILGLFSLAAVLIVRFAVAPAKAVLPSDTNTTRTYTGTAATLLNPAVLTGGSGPALLTNVPVTVTHRDAVLQTKGSNALVSDSKIVTANGTRVAGVDYKYAVDRTNLGTGKNFSGVVAQKGITFNWPVRTAKHDYTGWVSDTHTTTVLKYSGTAKRGGLTTYVFTTTTTPARITDSQVLAALPQALPKATLAQLAGTLSLPPALLAQLQAALPSLPDPVPFTYTYQVKATYYVAPKSGIVVDLTQQDVRTLNLTVGGQTVPVTPIMDLTFTSPANTLAAAASDAKDKGNKIDLLYSELPLWLGVIGGVLVLGGLTGFISSAAKSHPAPKPFTGSHERVEPTSTS